MDIKEYCEECIKVCDKLKEKCMANKYENYPNNVLKLLMFEGMHEAYDNILKKIDSGELNAYVEDNKV